MLKITVNKKKPEQINFLDIKKKRHDGLSLDGS